MKNEFASMKQLTKEQAVQLHDSKLWEDWSDEEIVRFQLFQEKSAIPFSKFHQSLEAVLGRPVFTHELALNYKGIVKEFLGETQPPTFDEIINLIPEEKRILVNLS